MVNDVIKIAKGPSEKDLNPQKQHLVVELSPRKNGSVNMYITPMGDRDGVTYAYGASYRTGK